MYHVLVVEDEPLIRDAIVEMVNQLEGFRVTGEASSCEEGWRLVQELWPTLIVTDIQLPDADGLELIRRIREQKSPIVTVIVSGHDNFSYAQLGIRLHVSEYLLKPISEKELHGALTRSLERLETFAEPNRVLLDIQGFVDGMADCESIRLFERAERILNTIRGSRIVEPGIRLSYVRIFAGKLAELIKAVDPSYRAPEPADAYDDREARQLIRELLHEWIRSYPQFANNNMRLVIKRACAYMEEHLQDEITLKQMADYANLSVSYFGVLFKQHTGKSFVNYLNQIRIEKALELLRGTDRKIYEIAESVGFVSLPYFNRVFKQVSSMAPNEYRKSLGV
ncbi:response regulator [Cohnella thailandensis]|uniref:Response regulator n=1 Tax=Cohnella thailandensis TaxID=557557 RepID=A0A841SVK9_9BACL|nr:response regulator [Cohnella thailandensis]MBB6634646.1 response regulator [Cohnella thailandensis]MBP1972798.1 two-component system response regulator YesN [Cohnella thailandensis]